MSEVYRVGRDRENDIVLDDATVSRAHAEVRLETKGGALLVDLHSTNGTCVREGDEWVEIDRATVDADERILIGDVVTTVDALVARRNAVQAARENRLAEEHSFMSDASNDAPENLSEPSSLRNSARNLSRRMTDDFARLVFRRGRSAAENSAHALPEAPAGRAGKSHRDPIETARSAPSFRLGPSGHDDADLDSFGNSGPGSDGAVDESTGAGMRFDTRPERESSSLIARRIGEQIGRRERLPSIQVEANPARRVAAAKTTPRRWVKSAVLSMAASMFLVAGIAAVALHGPGGDGSGSPADNPGKTRAAVKTPKPAAPPKSSAKRNPTNVAGKATGDPLPAGMRAFGGAKVDSFRAVTSLKGGGYLAIGSTESAGAGGFDLWLVRLDRSGGRVWEKRFGGENDDYGLAVAATADGGALVAGAADNRRFVWVLRTDDKGGVLWSRRIETGYRGHATSIAVTRDGFAVAAVVEAKKGAPVTSIVVRLDKDGGTMWQQSFGPRYTWISSVRATYGAFVVAGVTKADENGPNALWVAKLNPAGKMLWSKRMARANGKDAEAFARMARRGDIIVATTHQASAPGGLWPTRHARIVRLNKDGKVLWRHIHRGNGRERVGGMVLVKGGILLAGTTAGAAAPGAKPAKSDLWLAKIDTKSNTVWERRYGGAGADGASGFDQIGGQGLVLVGTTDAGPGRGRDGLLVAVDREGRILRRTVARKEQ